MTALRHLPHQCLWGYVITTYRADLRLLSRLLLNISLLKFYLSEVCVSQWPHRRVSSLMIDTVK